MKEKTKFNFAFFIMIMACIVLGIALANLYPIAKDYLDSKKILSYSETKDCEGLDLILTSECLREKLLPIYYYNISNIGKDLTDEQLEKEGGVCSNWAKFYEDRAKNLGFYTKQVIIKTDDKISHVFAVMSNDEGYCILDQMNVGCFNLGKVDLNETE